MKHYDFLLSLLGRSTVGHGGPGLSIDRVALKHLGLDLAARLGDELLETARDAGLLGISFVRLPYIGTLWRARRIVVSVRS